MKMVVVLTGLVLLVRGEEGDPNAKIARFVVLSGSMPQCGQMLHHPRLSIRLENVEYGTDPDLLVATPDGAVGVWDLKGGAALKTAATASVGSAAPSVKFCATAGGDCKYGIQALSLKGFAKKSFPQGRDPELNWDVVTGKVSMGGIAALLEATTGVVDGTELIAAKYTDPSGAPVELSGGFEWTAEVQNPYVEIGGRRIALKSTTGEVKVVISSAPPKLPSLSTASASLGHFRTFYDLLRLLPNWKPCSLMDVPSRVSSIDVMKDRQAKFVTTADCPDANWP